MKRRPVIAAVGLLAVAPWWPGGLAWSAADARATSGRWRSTLDGDHPLTGTIWSVADGRRVDEQALSNALRAARYRLLGEVHDNPDHHAIQLDLLRRIAESGLRPAVAFEQFDREHDAVLQERIVSGNATAEDVANAVRFDRRGWNWDFYWPLVDVALRNGMPLRATNLSSSAAGRIVKEGAQILGAARVAALRLESVWSPERERILRGVIFEGHCKALPEQVVPRMAFAQRARDATLAETLRGAGPDGAVLIAGNGHVRRDLAVPLYLEAAGGPVCAVGILEVEDGKQELRDYFDSGASLPPVFDFVYYTPRWPRPDPCAGFKPRGTT